MMIMIMLKFGIYIETLPSMWSMIMISLFSVIMN